MEKMKVGCGVKKEIAPMEASPVEHQEEMKEIKEVDHMIKVGQPAPDFVVTAYHKNEFVEVKLSDYLGKWVTLCFYPGDFTFV